MLVRLMLDPVRRGAGSFPAVVSAFVLGAAVLVSQAAGQDAGEAIPYFIADGAGVPGYQPSDGELARAAFEAWARESAGRLRFVEAGEADALIHLIWIAPGSGLYGEMRRVVIDDRPRAFRVRDARHRRPGARHRAAGCARSAPARHDRLPDLCS